MDGKTDTVEIFVSCDGEETVEEVSKKLEALSAKLKEQDVLYGYGTPPEVYEELKPALEISPYLADGCFDDGITAKGMVKLGEALGRRLYYDEESGLIWNSKELCDRHKKYVEKQMEKGMRQ